jgi:hypothetical protein
VLRHGLTEENANRVLPRSQLTELPEDLREVIGCYEDSLLDDTRGSLHRRAAGCGASKRGLSGLRRE